MEFDTGENSRGLASRVPCGTVAGPLQLTAGNAGDHRLVHAMLRAANQAPSYEDFLAWLDEPMYEPSDRLLVKLDGAIIAHVQVLKRVAWFHGVKLPIGGVDCLATLPEYRDAPYERLLVAAAEDALHNAQAVVAFTRTDRFDAFRQRGWSNIGFPTYTEANVHEVIARLSVPATVEPLAPRIKPLRIRLWRHVELDALLEVYRQAAAPTWGSLDRSEAYWRWLVGRHAHDDLIVAIDGRDDWESLESPSHIVGYAITRGSQVVELATLPKFRRAAEPLLARACQDAVERDHRSISLHIPLTDPLHELMLSAGGRSLTGERPGCGPWMLKLLDPTRWIESLYEVLLERARTAEIARPLAISFDTGRHQYRLELTRRSSHFARADGASADVKCPAETLGALFCSTLDVTAATQSGKLDFRNPDAAARVAALFPQVSFWQSPLDSLRL